MTLDPTKLKRGAKVYRVEAVDLPDVVLPVPMVREYVVTQLGKAFMAVRCVNLYRGKLKGTLGHQEKASLLWMASLFWHSPQEAIAGARKRAKAASEHARAEIASAERWERDLEALEAATEALS